MIDTAAKRRNISGIGSPTLIPGVTPNAAKPVGWRQQVGWGYSGITPIVPVVRGEVTTAVWLAEPGTREFLADPGVRTWLAEEQTG